MKIIKAFRNHVLFIITLVLMTVTHARALQSVNETNRLVSVANQNLALARDALKQNDYDGAIKHAQLAIEARPEESLLWLALGRGQLGIKRFDDAIASYQRAISLDTRSTLGPTDSLLANAYYLKGNSLVMAVTIDPKTNKFILPPGLADAYQHYLALAPSNAKAAIEVRSTMDGLGIPQASANLASTPPARDEGTPQAPKRFGDCYLRATWLTPQEGFVSKLAEWPDGTSQTAMQRQFWNWFKVNYPQKAGNPAPGNEQRWDEETIKTVVCHNGPDAYMRNDVQDSIKNLGAILVNWVPGA